MKIKKLFDMKGALKGRSLYVVYDDYEIIATFKRDTKDDFIYDTHFACSTSEHLAKATFQAIREYFTFHK